MKMFNEANQDLGQEVFSLNTPDSFRIDTGFADSIKIAALCSAECCETEAVLNADEGADVEDIDLAVRLRSAIACGEIDPVHAFDAVAFVLQTVCSGMNGSGNMFFREHVAIHLADMVRADSPLRPAWNSPVTYPIVEVDTESLIPNIDTTDTELIRTARKALTPALLRLGAMLTNLKLEPVGITTRPEAVDEVSVLTQWSIQAALTAFLDDSSDPEVELGEGELVAVLIIALTELFDWLDANIFPGLSQSATRHITDEFIAQRVVPSDVVLSQPTNSIDEAA